jgi:rod shape-determining protein MreB
MSKQIGIDLGTSNTIIYQKDKKGITLKAPSVVAIDRFSQEVIASGRTAKRMVGKTPSRVLALRPINDGVITDIKTTSMMLHDFFERMELDSVFTRPSALVCIPYGVTGVERRAVEEATLEAGARHVGLIDQPIAAAVGAGIQVSKARGAMVVDLGGGVSEAAVLSLGGVVRSNSLRVAGNELDQAIVNYLKQTRNILIGEISAERLKCNVGAAVSALATGSMKVCGRSLTGGNAIEIEVKSTEIYEALREPLSEIISMVKMTLEETPPELSADIFDRGIVVVGGGAMLRGIGQAISDRTGVRTIIAKNPALVTCAGLGKMLESANDFSEFVKYKS